MSEVLRLTLVAHAMTPAMAAGCFPDDEPLNDFGRRQTGRLDLRGDGRPLCAPELRARQTAELLGLRPAIEPRLADLDCRRWRGKPTQGVPPEALRTWLTDPRQAPHGGESIADLVARVADWLELLTGDPSRTVAVTHPAVIRAAVLHALRMPAESFWRMDVAPASHVTMHHRRGGWTLRL
ncbi:histidine phosphatase family protein [Mycobacterium parmense]|uniref:Phosphoglycerate mutase n=1 Tax=Mycobacterium parmense TaxID=185642 RepID=A0A7I7Z1N0_9MYCO|nr:histidine phosphatase family protein [Mycobacterium parmense]MCV7353046.1 histidine phosphatase family protein [Mycobacterium parmense]ORW55022.1 histidine phosphatase [Mycobacterium parmense]BBZ47063.1 phosphoglycerate mutase [Mycobacterium parmense]